jgi:putative membrane protein
MLEALVLASQDAHHYGPPPWWPIFPLLWLLVIAAIVFAAIRFGRRRGYGPGRGHGGLDRLADRFAAGEIDETEYRNRRAVLEEQFERRRR